MIELDRKLGDVWFYVAGDMVHAYLLTTDSNSEFTGWDIGHCISRDLYNWEYQGTTIGRGDNCSLATGSVIKYEDCYYMAYTSIKTARTGEHADWAVSMAKSRDLHNWEPYSDNPVLHEDPVYYELKSTGSRPFNHWRDPFLFVHDDGIYMFICARKNTGDIATRGCAAVFRSHDMINWRSLGPLDTTPFSEEMEVPQVYYINNKYYFNFSTPVQLVCEEMKQRIGGDDTCGDYSFVSDDFTGPYHFRATGTVADFISGEEFGYAGQIVEFKGKYYYLTRILYPESSGRQAVISDPIEVEATQNGIIYKK